VFLCNGRCLRSRPMHSTHTARNTAIKCIIMYRTAPHCTKLYHTDCMRVFRGSTTLTVCVSFVAGSCTSRVRLLLRFTNVMRCARCSTLQHTATPCNTLQHPATPCNTLQHTATHCHTLQHTATRRNALQHAATHCNSLQHTNTLQYAATRCSTSHVSFLLKFASVTRCDYMYVYIYI